MEENQHTTCASNGNNYAIQCGIVYEGIEIDTSDINEMYPSSSSTIAVLSPSAVMIEVLPRTSSTAPASSAVMIEVLSRTSSVAPAPSATGREESDESGTGGLSGVGPAVPVESDDGDDEDDMSEM
jgi:hypothetical protein